MKPRDTDRLEPPPGNITLATKRKQVETWLAALPLNDPERAAETLRDYLKLHRHGSVARPLHQALIARALPLARRIVADLVANPVLPPLAPPCRRRIQRAISLLHEAATGLRRLLETSDVPVRTASLAANLLQLLATLRRVVELCYASHLPVPRGTWLALHQLYRQAVEHNLQTAADTTATLPVALETQYTALVLAALADPYGMSTEQWAWTVEIVDRYAELAAVVPVAARPHGGVFAIRVDRDQPPQPLAWFSEPPEAYDFVLDTAPLARQLALLGHRLADDGRADHRAPTPGEGRSAYAWHVDRLRQRWGGSSQRHSLRRRSPLDSECEVIFGFPGLHRAFDLYGTRRHGDHRHLCRMFDESAGGVALDMKMIPGLQLAVGNLMAIVRDPRGAGGDIGLVCWFKALAPDEVRLGVRFLTGTPASVEIRNGKEISPGLLLQRRARNPRGGTLILPISAAPLPAIVEIRLGNRTLVLRLLSHPELAADVRLLRWQPT